MSARPSKRVPGWWGRKCREFDEQLRRQAELDHARAKADAAELAARGEEPEPDFADQDTGSAVATNPAN